MGSWRELIIKVLNRNISSTKEILKEADLSTTDRKEFIIQIDKMEILLNKQYK